MGCRERVSLCLLVVALAAAGCKAEPASEATAEPVAQAPASLVEGWDCADAEACFGLVAGRTLVFERRLGEQVRNELWLVTDAFAQDDGSLVFVQEGGPEHYELRADGLSFSIRGELLPALRFPVKPGDQFKTASPLGQSVTMRVLEHLDSVDTAAGRFEDCFVHEAIFANEELADGSGLSVRTTLCKGVGEVAQRIAISAAALPIEFTLLSREKGAIVGLAEPISEPPELP